jgi:hypothetical protein
MGSKIGNSRAKSAEKAEICFFISFAAKTPN